MKNYILSIIIISLCTGIADLIQPGKDGDPNKKNIKFIGAFCLVCAIIWPLTPLINNYGSISGYIDSLKEDIYKNLSDISGSNSNLDNEELNNIFIDKLIVATEKNAENAIKAELIEKFNISSDDCTVEVIITKNINGTAEISKTTITLSGEAIWQNPYKIEEYINKSIGCECVVRSSD